MSRLWKTFWSTRRVLSMTVEESASVATCGSLEPRWLARIEQLNRECDGLRNRLEGG